MSYKLFKKHLTEVKANPLCNKWAVNNTDALGKKSSPIELLLLGTLRYFGRRGWTLDYLEESTFVSEETHQLILHTYAFWGSTELYDKYVLLPESPE
mmetsp:Transcript_283/g.407  ORF Transcript_283/g.407 Transcript_283/m.407 type:complete len:97 (+) Transcript_283:520-810(+)